MITIAVATNAPRSFTKDAVPGLWNEGGPPHTLRLNYVADANRVLTWTSWARSTTTWANYVLLSSMATPLYGTHLMTSLKITELISLLLKLSEMKTAKININLMWQMKQSRSRRFFWVRHQMNEKNQVYNWRNSIILKLTNTTHSSNFQLIIKTLLKFK